MSQDAIEEMVERTFATAGLSSEEKMGYNHFQKVVEADPNLLSWFEALGSSVICNVFQNLNPTKKLVPVTATFPHLKLIVDFEEAKGELGTNTLNQLRDYRITHDPAVMSASISARHGAAWMLWAGQAFVSMKRSSAYYKVLASSV
ncbi:hypothetical protein SeLEV6574_g02328 [Synchytrium endobioticum]|uniref:Uncharacterized protein n=1 Tax=Synchytrium endobioticum TaxID=286115 RepID=A0A507DAN1_9FUNG|nr:hypothetical protein SeLEV6574_g02328 [Synchytrium endobioticum]